MDINTMTEGQVMVLYDDIEKKKVSEIDVKLLKDKALILKANKTTGNVTMSIKDTLFEDKEFEGLLTKDALITIAKALKDIYVQL